MPRTPSVAACSLLAQVFRAPTTHDRNRDRPMPPPVAVRLPGPRPGTTRRSSTGYRSLTLTPSGLGALREWIVSDPPLSPYGSHVVWVLPSGAVLYADAAN